MIDREKIIKENQCYDRLTESGYRPQGLDVKTRKVVIFKQSKESFDVFYFNSYREAVSVLLDRTAADGQKIVDYEQIKAERREDCDLLAIGNDGRQYRASYSAKLESIFYCIPRSVKVIGYIGA